MVPFRVSKMNDDLTVVLFGAGIWKLLAVLLKMTPVGPLGGPPAVGIATVRAFLVTPTLPETP